MKQVDTDYTSSYITTDITSADNMRKSCQDFIKIRSKWKSFEYGEQPDNEKTKGVFRTIAIADIPFKNNLLKKPEIVQERITEGLVKSAKLIGFRFEHKEKSILFLKKITTNFFVLTDHSKFHRVIKGVATLFRENLVNIPGEFDIVKFGDTLLIFNPYQFEELFNYHILHEKDRKEVFDYIKKKADYKIANLEDIEEIIKRNRRFLRKFGPIKDKQIYNQKLSDIKKILKKRKVPTLKITGNEMKFQGTRALIYFFNDNHLSSYFTKRNYTSHSKTEE